MKGKYKHNFAALLFGVALMILVPLAASAFQGAPGQPAAKHLAASARGDSEVLLPGLPLLFRRKSLFSVLPPTNWRGLIRL